MRSKSATRNSLNVLDVEKDKLEIRETDEEPELNIIRVSKSTVALELEEKEIEREVRSSTQL